MRIRGIACILAVLGPRIFGQGSAVITLVMPPPGADGYSALQSGGTFPTGAASLYYNPALLPELERATGSQLHFSSSGQDLLPLVLRDFRQDFWGLAAVAPDPEKGYDVGVGYFSNLVSFGQNIFGPGGNPFSNEHVHALGIGVRLGFPINLGGTAKFFDSRLIPGYRAYGWAFDLGILVRPRVFPLGQLGIRSLTLVPSLGVSQHNMGPDAFYTDPEYSDPLPATSRTSLGFNAAFADFAEISVGQDWDRENHRRARSARVQAWTVQGYTVSLLFYRYSRGWLGDPSGDRFEMHDGHALEFDLLRFMRLMNRWKSADFKSSSAAVEAGFPFGRVRVFGIPFRANPRFTWGRRVIDSRRGGIRDDQKAEYLSISL